jgi:hypothetical protein
MGMKVDDTLKRGYAAVRSAIEVYARRWRNKKDVKVELRRPLVSEKLPRRPVERECIVRAKINPNPLHPISQEVKIQLNQRDDNIRDSGSPEKNESQGETIHSPHRPSPPEDVSSMPQNTPHTPQRMEGSRNVSPMYGNASGPRTDGLHSRSQVSMSDLSSSPPWLLPMCQPCFPNDYRSLGSSSSPPTIGIASPQRTTVSGQPSSRIPRPNFNKGGKHLLGTSDIIASKMGQVIKRSADEEPFLMCKRRKLNVRPTANDASTGIKSYIPITNAKLAKQAALDRSHYTRIGPNLRTKRSCIPRLQKQSGSVKTRLLGSSRVESVTSRDRQSSSISPERDTTPVTFSLAEISAQTRICETNDGDWDHPENVGPRTSSDDDHDQSISHHPSISPISSVNSEIQSSTSTVSTSPTPEPPEFSPSTFTNQTSDSGEDTFPSPRIPLSPSTASPPRFLSPQVRPEFQELLRISIYPIEHLASSASPLEQLTLREFAAMCLLAKQRGAIREFKRLWRKYSVIPPVGWEENDENSRECTWTSPGIDSQPERPTLDTTQSPVRDLSPPAPFRRGRIRFRGNGSAALVWPRYRYYRATFAGRDLPVLLVGYCCPTTKKLICCYGGTRDGERVYLSSWRYS